MEYHWNGSRMSRVAVLPAAVGDYLKLATEGQLKVLLWVAVTGGGDAAACAAALGGRTSVQACEEALRFWVEEGLLTADGAVSARAAAAPAAKAETPAPVARPLAVKPQMPEVVKKQKSSRKFSFLLTEAGTQLGKALSPADQETLLYLYDTAGLPAEVILTVIAYAVKHGKGNMRYVEKTALDWADRDIRTIKAADAYLRRLSRQESAFETVSGWCDLPPRPTVAQKELLVKWLDEWAVGQELLCHAAHLCAEKIGKFQYTYIDRILEGWHIDGLDTVEKVTAAVRGSKPQPASAADGGFDVQGYEEMVRQYKPRYRKKGQT